MTPAGIEPATFRFAAQHRNHCATAVPDKSSNNSTKPGMSVQPVLLTPVTNKQTNTCNFFSLNLIQTPTASRELTPTEARTADILFQLKNKNQLDVTYYFIVLLIGSTCFGHYCAHHQELTTIMLITTLVDSFLGCCRLEVRCG